jgi:hypothetical protein
MSKKAGPKQKTIDKQKDKIFKDSTFGIKNKNKSKTVQKEIKGMEINMKGITKEQKKEQEEKEKRKLEKLAEKQREKELQALFRKVDDGKDEEKKPETVEELDDQIEEELKDEAEMTLEELVEKARAKIIEGTKVTYESFLQWKSFKKEQKEKEEERKRKLLEVNYKKTGQGLSGKALFEHNANLFIDDEDAADVDEYKVEDENQMDDSLFLDGEVEDEINDKTFTEKKEDDLIVEDYTPETWKDKKTPKALLLEYLQSKGVSEKDVPIFAGGEKESICMVTLPHVGVDLKNKKTYKLKKIAEHNAALLALAWLKREETKKK